MCKSRIVDTISLVEQMALCCEHWNTSKGNGRVSQLGKMWAFIYIFMLFACFNNCIAFKVQSDELLTKELIWPTEYHLKGEEIYLHAGIKETFEVWYSANLNRSRLDYYGGIYKTYYYGGTDNSTGTIFELHPITTEETYNELKCFEFSNRNPAENFLPSVYKFVFKGTKVETNRTLQTWEKTVDLEDSVKVETKVLVYVQDDAHIPVQIELKQYNLDKGDIDEHTITNYYGYESEFDEDYLEVETDFYGCDNQAEYGENLANDLKYLHPGIAAASEFAFQRFKLHHKREYDGHEHEIRKQIFHKNWKIITEHNKKNLSYKLEVNAFADRTRDELRFLTGTKPSKAVADPSLFSDTLKLLQSVDQLPEELDLRLEGVINPIKNQAACGSCWAFATTAAVEGAIARKNGGRDLDLSEQSLVDCAWGFDNAGCDGGLIDGAMKYVLAHGIPTENEYGPYLMKDGLCGIRNMSRVYNINGFGQVTPRNVEALKAVLNKYGPVVVGVHASGNMVFYSHGIFYDVNCEWRRMNHAVTVVGYGVRNGDTYWIVKNSWGESWGEDGYILISATNNNCFLMDVAYYPIV